MALDFTGAYAKIARANQQLGDLHESIATYFDQAHPIGSGYDAEAQELLLYPVGYEDAPAVEWGIRIGEYLHNLRSALDHVIWQFAILHLGRQPTDAEAPAIQFPIALEHRGYLNARVRKYVSADATCWFDHFQPYHSQHPSAHKLAILARLNNIDKHRVIHTAALVPESFELELGEAHDVESHGEVQIGYGMRLREGQPFGRITNVIANGPNPFIEGEGRSEFTIALDAPGDPLDGLSLITLLTEIGEMTDGVTATTQAVFT